VISATNPIRVMDNQVSKASFILSSVLLLGKGIADCVQLQNSNNMFNL